MIHIILLSGGSGTRLWPLSNNARSKQFLKVLRDGDGNRVSMVQRTFSLIAQASLEADFTVAACSSQQAGIEAQIEGSFSLVLEPERRDTAPAIMLACAHLAFVQGADPADTVVVLPIDPYTEQAYYDKIVDLDAAVHARIADLVLMGVEPAYPSEKYGYIVPASRNGGAWRVARFKEKPREAEAKELLAEGALWNCGVFAFRLEYLLGVMRDYVDAHCFEDVFDGYSKLPKNSFDYAVVEKAPSVAVVPYSGEWKDLGTWNTLCEEMADEHSGRATVDEATCRGVHVINETGLPMVVAGLSDSVVVATPDGILVSGKRESARLKPLVEKAALSRPMYERRHWGEYRVLDSSVHPDGRMSLAKELVVGPGCQLSYQAHARRSEVWTVVSGEGEVVLDGEVSCVGVGSVAKIPPGRMHAVRAFTELRIIEVQLGDVLVEEDIVRFGYYWNSIEGPKGKAVAVGDDACNEDLFGHGRAEGKDGAA